MFGLVLTAHGDDGDGRRRVVHECKTTSMMATTMQRLKIIVVTNYDVIVVSTVWFEVQTATQLG